MLFWFFETLLDTLDLETIAKLDKLECQTPVSWHSLKQNILDVNNFNNSIFGSNLFQVGNIWISILSQHVSLLWTCGRGAKQVYAKRTSPVKLPRECWNMSRPCHCGEWCVDSLLNVKVTCYHAAFCIVTILVRRAAAIDAAYWRRAGTWVRRCVFQRHGNS